MDKDSDVKLNKSNSPVSDYNRAIITHCPSQQSATIVIVKKPSIINNIYGISNKSDTNEKDTDCVRDKVKLIILFFVLCTLFLCSVTGFYIMWFTEIYNDGIISSLVLAKNSTAVKWWQTPPLEPQLRIYLFNYTNAQEYLSGEAKKLVVKEHGPYVYVEKYEKVNITFHENHTISYREHRSYKFAQELSNGHEHDLIMFPNIALLTASSYIRHEPAFAQMPLNYFLSPYKAFKNLTAHEFIWGYEEPILDLKNKFGTSSPTGNKFGMLMTRNGTSADLTTIFTGEDDIQKLSLINRFNGQPNMNFWSTKECNNFNGTDGSQFPPQWMDKKTSLNVFIKAFCRKFPLVYDQEVNILDGIPAWRYKAPLDVFAHPDYNPENSCYCNTQTNDCPPSGVFNATLCFDAPIFSSFPHFFTGDPSLFKDIEGLEPDEKKHLTYADVHPRLAFPIDGASRFQINVQVQKAYWITNMNPLKEGQYLPVLWMEVTSGKLSDELRATIYHSTFSLNAIQLSLKYGSLVTAVILALLMAAFHYIAKTKKMET